MSWCDKLASTPSVGLRLSHLFLPSDKILEALSPVFNSLMVDGNQRFSIDKQEPFGLTFSTDDGLTYGIAPERMYIEFRHRMKVKPVSGGPPIMEMISEPLPYTQLLPSISKKLIDTAMRLCEGQQRTVGRVGVISTTNVAFDEIPPGISRLVEYYSRPWKGAVGGFSYTISAELRRDDEYVDVCIHRVIRPEDPAELMTLSFDWQRNLKEPRPVSAKTLKGLVDDAEKSALAYFEELAEGGRFDEEIIRSTADL